MNAFDLLVQEQNRNPSVIEGLEVAPEYQHPDEPCAEESAADLLVELVCVDCGNRLEHDQYVESWLKCTVLYDPNACDIDNNGQWCPETDEEHRLAPAASDRPCTHHSVTREHVEQCCAEGIDCDRCSKLITWERLGLTVGELLALDSAVLCSDCEGEL